MKTATLTTTATRLQLLEVNLRVAAHRLHPDPDRFIRRVLEPCIRQKLLRRLLFLGLDDQETIQAYLSLAVDWSKHERLAVVKGRLHVNGHYIEQGEPALSPMLEKFEEAVADGGLRVALVLHLCPGADTTELRSLLGLRAAPQYRWASQPAGTSWSLQKLPEMRVTLALADDDTHGG